MDAITILALGFVGGVVVASISLLALVGRYKFENMRMKFAFESTLSRSRNIERLHAAKCKSLIDADAENQRLQSEVERLRHEKLKAWDIPGGL